MKKGKLLRLLAALLIICMLVPAFASCSFSVSNDPAQSKTATEAGEPRTPYANLGDDFLIGDTTLSFQYTKADEAKLRNTLSEMEGLLDTGINDRRLMRLYESFEEQCLYLSKQRSLAEVEYYLFLEDEKVRENFLSISALATEMQKNITLFYKEVYDSGLKEAFFAGWSDGEIKEMLLEAERYEGDLSMLLLVSDEQLVEYRTCLSTGDYWGICDVYLDFVKNNNQIARHYGYDNYMKYAYHEVYGRDYDVEESSDVVTYIKEKISPLFTPLLQRYFADIQSISSQEYDELSDLINNHDITNEQGLAFLKAFYNSMNPKATELLEGLIDDGDYFISDSESSYAGAFTATLEENDRALVYFGPGYHELLTSVHEFGHYMASHLSSEKNLNFDMAEVQSQGGEMLFLRYLESIVSPNVARVYAEYILIDSLLITLLAACVNEFEIQVYENIDTLKNENLASMFSACIDEMFDMPALSAYINDLSNYWLYVVVESPAYYISYSVSQLAAFMIYAEAGDNYEDTCDLYFSLLGVDTDGFCTELEKAKLYTPFDERLYAMVSECFIENFDLTVSH